MLGVVDDRRAVVYPDHAEIPLGRNGFQGVAIVDVEDAWLDEFKWTLSAQGYATRDPHQPIHLMHTMLLGRQTKGIIIDHRNRNRLDNRRSNLRPATRTMNNINSALRKDNVTGVKGVCWDKSCKRWRVTITSDKGKVNRYRRTIEEAINLRKELEGVYHV